MKANYHNIIVAIACLACSLLMSQSIKKDNGKIPKKDRIDLAMSQEVLMTASPQNGKINKRNLLQASKYLRQLNETAQTRSSAIEWNERGPNNIGGRTRAMIYDQNDASGKTVYAAGVSGGLWKTTNIIGSNPNWQPIDDFFGSLAICALAQDENSPSKMYFGTGEGYFDGNSSPGVGMWKTVNGGNSWTYLASTSNDDFEFIQNIAVGTSGELFAATKAGLFKSTNEGGSWIKILGASKFASSDNINQIIVGGANVLYATIGLFNQDGIYKSTNNGTTWTKLSGGLPTNNYSRIEMAIAPSNQDVLYALFEKTSDSSCLGIYKSSNGGTSWTEMNNPGAYGMTNFARTQAWYNLTVAVNPTDANQVFIGGIDLLKSSNGGVSWSQLTHWTNNGPFDYAHPDQHAIIFNPNNANQMLVGNDGGVWYSDNASNVSPTFQSKNKGYNITQFYGAALHPQSGSNYILAGAQDNGSQKFNSAGINSTTEVSGGDGVRCYIDEDNPQIQITSYAYNNYFVSNDGGNTFNYLQLNNYGFFANPTAYDSEANILYGSTSSGNVLRWKNPHNLSAAFQHIIITSMTGQKASCIKVSPNNPDRLYIGTASGDVLYVDGANSGIFKTGTVIKNSSFGFVSSIDIEEGNEDHIVMTYSNYGMSSIFETTNGGSTWIDVEGDLPDIPVRDILMNPGNTNELFIATELGVWKSDENRSGNTHWTPENDGMANVRVDQLIYRSSDNVLAAATHGRGLYTTTLESSAVPVDFVSFDIRYDSNKKHIEVCWEVANEVNVDKYVVQKSFDGEEWDDIQEVKAENSSAVKELCHYDSDLYITNHLYFYRIKSVDFDGTFKLTEMRSVYLDEKSDKVIPKFYPNPFQESFSIQNIGDFEVMTVNDSTGRTILEINLTNANRVDMANYPDGVYFLSYTSNNGRRGIEKVIKQSATED